MLCMYMHPQMAPCAVGTFLKCSVANLFDSIHAKLPALLLRDLHRPGKLHAGLPEPRDVKNIGRGDQSNEHIQAHPSTAVGPFGGA